MLWSSYEGEFSFLFVFFLIAGSTIILTLWATWTKTAEGTVSPLCSMKQGGSLCSSPQTTGPSSTEWGPGSQVENTSVLIAAKSSLPPSVVSTKQRLFFYFPHVFIALVHTGKLDARLKAVLLNSTKWQYYGTPNVGGSLYLLWNTSLVKAERLNIELWGYRESGQYWPTAGHICNNNE